ncbi:MAG: hypothetical protein ACLP8Y_07600 [Thermoplasmata archaeon]
MQAPRNTAVRRFATLWTLSFGIKLVALAVFLFLAVKLLGGF